MNVSPVVIFVDTRLEGTDTGVPVESLYHVITYEPELEFVTVAVSVIVWPTSAAAVPETETVGATCACAKGMASIAIIETSRNARCQIPFAVFLLNSDLWFLISSALKPSLLHTLNQRYLSLSPSNIILVPI